MLAEISCSTNSNSSNHTTTVITSPAPSHLPSKLKAFFKLSGSNHKKDSSVSSANGCSNSNEEMESSSWTSIISKGGEKITFTGCKSSEKNKTIGSKFLKDQSNNQKLRRVASAPNTKVSNHNKFNNNTEKSCKVDFYEPISSINLSVPVRHLTEMNRSGTFKRTYSSNSIKIKRVEVGPNSFQKIKLLGKGDVGKVYLVREKKSSKLYAMKGESLTILFLFIISTHYHFITIIFYHYDSLL